MYFVEDPLRQERMLARLHRLIGELIRGTISRNAFEPWEIEILLDIENCVLEPRTRAETLRKYYAAVERQFDTEEQGLPMKLSEFLQRRTTRRPFNS